MKEWVRPVRGAVGMSLTWAAGWVLVGLLIGVTSLLLPGLPWASFAEVFDAPLPAVSVPGFLGGMFFSTVLGIAERRRRFSELSLPAFAGWGAVGGLVLTLFPTALVAVGLGTVNPNTSLWKITAAIIGPITLLSAVSGAGSLALARVAQPWRTLLVQLLASDQSEA